MGNRAVISFGQTDNDVGVYLHWNGGPESVMAFCHAAREMGSRSPKGDQSYAMAGLIRAITLFMHSGGGSITSVGVDVIKRLDCDNWDNGHYVIGDDWEIQYRRYRRHAGENPLMAFGGLSDGERQKYDGIKKKILDLHALKPPETSET